MAKFKKIIKFHKPNKLTKIFKYIFETILVIAIIICVLISIGYYMSINHGYNSSDKVINQYVFAIDHNDNALIKLCFDTKSKSYTNDIKTAVDTRTNITQDYTIDYDNISIESSEYNDLSNIKSVTKAMSNIVTLPITQTWNGTQISVQYHYKFITYCTNKKWFIYNTELVSYSDTDALKSVGSDETGYITVPETWQESISSSQTDYIAKDITYTSQTDEMLSMMAINNKVTIADMQKIATKELKSKNYTYVIDTDAKIGNNKCVLISGLSEDKQLTDMIWLFAKPQSDKYTHYIEISCNTINTQDFIDYVMSLTN